VAPEHYHATSIFPEYFQMKQGEWQLLRQSRMDCVVVQLPDGALAAREFRHLRSGDLVAVGRSENGEDGILVQSAPFLIPSYGTEKFAFRKGLSRETSFSVDYDELYGLLDHDRQKGFVVWVAGPALVFDRDSRNAFAGLVERGYVHALLAGNALAVHDLEASLLGTALGQDIYSKRASPLGHYNHLDTINRMRTIGSIEAAVGNGVIKDGIMHAVVRKHIPYVLAGSIRDDGPLPGVEADAYVAQDRMRRLMEKATTVLALATQLHAIAAGNMVPSYAVPQGGGVRPVYFYTVDMSEFTVTKLLNRGSLTARSIITNVQDFLVTLARGLK
jgi:lysine-ketoglutarate reductase/saccharopine dehydrogenase-like protein (TIGR00300 family)